MSNEEIIARQRAHRAHQAAVPMALGLARTLSVDHDGRDMVDGEAIRDGLTCAQLRTLVAEIDRLTLLVRQQQRDAAEEQREFQREARDIAAEARWQAIEETRDGGY